MSRFLMTQTLLNSWNYLYKAHEDYQDSAKEDFLRVLRREPGETTEAMRMGNEFEELVQRLCVMGETEELTNHAWYPAIKEVAREVKGGRFQAALYRDVSVDGIQFLLYGKLDVLKAGTIYDMKFSKRSYSPGKYLDSPQHPMYFALCPEARRFQYLVSNGTEVFRETYYPESTDSIKEYISGFLKFLKFYEHEELYFEKWSAYS